MQQQKRLARSLLALAACAAFGAAVAAPDQPAATNSQAGAQYQAAINSPARMDEDRKLDAKRKPAEFLAFVQAKPGMKVVDLVAGGGVTSALLAAAVAPGGDVWAQTSKPPKKIAERIESGKVPNLHSLVTPFDNPIPKDVPPLDLVTMNMNYHDLVNIGTDRAAMNKHIYDALKPGGHYVVIDNSAKNGTGLAATNTLHRIDEATVIEEVTRAGFKVEAKDDYLRAPSDPREQSFEDMKGQPDDKFAIRFVKK